MPSCAAGDELCYPQQGGRSEKRDFQRAEHLRQQWINARSIAMLEFDRRALSGVIGSPRDSKNSPTGGVGCMQAGSSEVFPHHD